MKHSLLALALLLTAPMMASAQSCADLESQVRTEATVLSGFDIEIKTLAARFETRNFLLASEVELAETYGWDEELEVSVKEQQADLEQILQEHAELNSQAHGTLGRLQEAMGHYRAVCGKEAELRIPGILEALGLGHLPR